MEEKWTTVLKPRNKWLDINLKELFSYKDLVFLFVKRNYVTKYKQTILGPLWMIISPLLTTLMHALVFGGIAGISTDGAPQLAFYMAGNVIWTYFAACVNQTSNTFVTNANVFGKVYFPRMVVPVSTVLTGLLDFLIQFVLFLIILLIYGISGAEIVISPWVLATPLLVLQLALLGMGVGIIVSSLTTKYRDLTILVTFGVQLWMYASPVVYSINQIPERYQFLYLLNPVSPIITIFRYAFLGSGYVPMVSWGISWIVTLVIVAVGVILFSRIEKTFMDTV
ncbi:MAG: ABC transporter permease [Lachnospiraceae bacterium]|nr:ABC transporter permease [Lachnospiraceae bacterium]MBQ7782253.1 ABC transporter permease [Lachnospiraceae bacterium]